MISFYNVNDRSCQVLSTESCISTICTHSSYNHKSEIPSHVFYLHYFHYKHNYSESLWIYVLTRVRHISNKRLLLCWVQRTHMNAVKTMSKPIYSGRRHWIVKLAVFFLPSSFSLLAVDVDPSTSPNHPPSLFRKGSPGAPGRPVPTWLVRPQALR